MNISHPVIELTGVSKKYSSNWIFRNISAKFEGGKKYAVTGPNGSGKSTLLKIIAGIVTPNEGKVTVTTAKGGLDINELFRLITYCGPQDNRHSQIQQILRTQQLPDKPFHE